MPYDRRGRGDSGDTAPYAVDREVEDLAAVLDAVGGSAAVYGHSSGAGLVLHAVAAGLPVDRIVLHEPPYSPDDAESRDEARRFALELRALLAAGARGEAVELFVRATGAPDEVVAALRADPALLAVAPTLAYDSAVMGDLDGGAVPEDLVAAAQLPGLVLAGGGSPPFVLDVARRVADLLLDGRLHVPPGQGHVVDPEVLAPVVADFLAG